MGVPPTIPVPVQAVQATPVRGQRHFLAVFFFSFMWGIFGADRFYLGKIWTGLLKLVTLGGFGLWAMTDLVLVMSGGMRDKQGNEMLEFAHYKKLANTTVLISTIAIAVIIIVTAATLIITLSPILTKLLNGGNIQDLLPGVMQVPGIDQLNAS